jgi:hypothetical protein
MGTDPILQSPGRLVVDQELVRTLNLFAAAVAGCWSTCLSLPALVDLQDSAHDSHGPVIQFSCNRPALRILAGIPDSSSSLLILRKALIFQSSSSWYSVQFPGPFCLIRGLKCLARQVGHARGVVDCPRFPAGSGLFLQLLQHSLGHR